MNTQVDEGAGLPETKEKQDSGLLSLIDDKELCTKKARMKKAAELSKHSATVNNLKRKLAKQIVNNTLKIEDFKQLTLEDLFKHSNVIEQEKQERKKNLLAILNHPDLKERDRLMEIKRQ